MPEVKAIENMTDSSVEISKISGSGGAIAFNVKDSEC